MRELGFKRVLFIVHRAQLAKQAKKSFEKVFNKSISMGIVGDGKHEYDRDFVFAMVETLNRDEHLFKYEKNTFDCIILDEAQNTTPEQMKMFLTRLGFNSKMVITGDVTQIDLPDGRKSGLKDVMSVLKHIDDIAQVHFNEKDVVRHRLVQNIIKAYEEREGKGQK